MPHHQNTGGFFICLIRKLATNDNNSTAVKEVTPVEVVHSNNEDSNESSNNSSNDSNGPADPTGRAMKGAPAKRLKHVYDENPFRFCVNENELDGWPRIQDFFGIKKEFPLAQLMMRNRKGENVKNVYFVSKNIHDIVELNGDRIKFM